MSVIAFAALCGGACAGSTAAPTGTDAGQDAGGLSNTDVAPDTAGCPAAASLITAAPTCNTVVNGAIAVPFTQGSGAPPVLVGGTIRDGLYTATRAEGFGNATPSGRRLTLAVLDGATRFLFNGEVLDAAGAQVTLTFQVNATASITGSSVNFTTTCMSGASNPLPAALDFTATGDTLIMGLSGGGTSTSVTTYTRHGCP